MLLALLDVAVTVQDRESAALLASRLAPCAALSTTWTNTACPARLLAAAASLLGDPEKARGYLRQALENCAKIGFRPELALSRLELAELLLRNYPDERPEALAHVDFAIEELTAMGMEPAMERALRLSGRRRERREARGPALPDGLTQREAEVLCLSAGGKSNREIGDALVLSVRTVERHITNLYAKIDAHGKADATAYALHKGLI